MTDDLEKMPSGGARKLSPVGLVIAIGMIFMALAFTACGGSDDSGSDAGGTGGDAPASDSGGSGDSADSGGDADSDGGGEGEADQDTLAALIAAGNRVNEISRYQVEFKIEISGQPTQVGFINVDGENTHMQFAELELISVDGVTYINVGGSWQELPTAAGAGAVANSPFSPQTVTSNLEDLEALNASGVEIVDAGTVDVPGGTCHAYTMTIDSEPGNATFCLDEDSGILRQMVITEAATNTTVTMTFSYEDMAVTAP